MRPVAVGARVLAAITLAVAPSYIVERVTEFYFLTNSPAFGGWSAYRMEVFIVLILAGAILAGLFLGELRLVATSYLAGVGILLSLFYAFCAPNVCYSTGLDGMEPLRLGYFLGCIALAGVIAGANRTPHSRKEGFWGPVLGVTAFTSVSFLPVIYTVAGTNLLYPFQPWALVSLVLLLSLSVGAMVSARTGWVSGVATPVAALSIVLGLSSGIAEQYPGLVVQLAPLLLITALAGSLVGVYAARMGPHRLRGFAPSARMFLAVVLLALLVMVPSIPDAVAGVSPSTGSASQLVFSSPAYAGGFMSGGLTRTRAVAVNVTFAGTNASVIQADNYLAVGVGVHAAGCCVDGIDYGYRLDVFLFHGGGEEVVASAWQICDTNAACGGHPWRNLMIARSAPLAAPLSANIRLVIQWEGRTVRWDYSYDGVTAKVASLNGTSQENAEFDVGAFGGGWGGQSGSYGLQFGVTSRYTIGRPGWGATFACPAYINSSAWTCVPHAETLQGGQSFWKALWRWGENYGDVTASASTNSKSVTFSFGEPTMANFQTLW